MGLLPHQRYASELSSALEQRFRQKTEKLLADLANNSFEQSVVPRTFFSEFFVVSAGGSNPRRAGPFQKDKGRLARYLQTRETHAANIHMLILLKLCVWMIWWKVFFFDIRKMTLPLCICNLVCKIISEIWGMRRFSKLP